MCKGFLIKLCHNPSFALLSFPYNSKIGSRELYVATAVAIYYVVVKQIIYINDIT